MDEKIQLIKDQMNKHCVHIYEETYNKLCHLKGRAIGPRITTFSQLVETAVDMLSKKKAKK
jgi:hypothetical protein